MRILIVHHGTLPAPHRAVTGGALRAWHHGRALQAAGHEVFYLTREQDAPGGYANSRDLAWRARRLDPDRIICVQLEEAAALGSVGRPVAVDLFAPRLLEAPFEGHLARAAVEALQALASGSVFLVSNPRQRWSWLGVMALAGIDIRTDPTLHIPLIAPTGPRRRIPREPLFVAGGAAWPWQDPIPALQRVLAHLDSRGRGRVIWFGGAPLIGQGDHIAHAWHLPEHPRLETPGWLPYDDLLKQYAVATAALDWMAPNPERSLALSFRHVDHLGCGLPILTSPDSALTDVLGDAGWISDDIEGTLDAVLDAPSEVRRRGKAAAALARSHFSSAVAEAPLLAWVETGLRHRKARGPLIDAAASAAQAATERTRREALETMTEDLRAEVVSKRAEAEGLTAQIQQLTGIVAQLTRALDEVAGFKREAVAVLGGQVEQSQRSAAEAEREVTILRADIAKKSAELRAMDQVRERLENDLDNLRRELEQERRRGGLLRRSLPRLGGG